MKKNFSFFILIICFSIGILIGLNIKKLNSKNQEEDLIKETNDNSIIHTYKFDEYSNIKIPYINLNTHRKEIMEINENIKEIMLSNDSLKYKYYTNKDILTIVITNNDEIIKSYNINTKSGSIMSFNDICDYMNINVFDLKKYLDYRLKENNKDEVKFWRTSDYIKYQLYDEKSYYIDENYKLHIILDEENIVINDISVPIDNDQATLNYIVENELYLLGGKKNINEITNKEKVWYAFKISDWTGTNLFEIKEGENLKNVFKSSSFSELGLELENIYSEGDKGLRYEYSKYSDRFTDVGGHRGTYYVDSMYVKTNDYVKNGNKYTISAKYLWIYQKLSPSTELYGSYEDASKEHNPVYISKDKNTFTYDELNEIIENNNIETYNFTFEKKDGQFKLVEFSVTK